MVGPVRLLFSLLAVRAVNCQQVVLAPQAGLTLKIERASPVTPSRFAAAISDIMDTGQVRDVLSGTDHRVLHAEELYLTPSGGKREPNSFRVAVADYTNDRTIYLSGDDISAPASSVSVEESSLQPNPSVEEVAEAARIAGFGDDADASSSMPPLINNVFPNGSSHRILKILARKKGGADSVLLYVNMNNRTATVVPSPSSPQLACSAPPDKRGRELSRGLPGAAKVTISQGATELWKLEVVRPSSSSGQDGSGVELRYVTYRGKSVLRRAHLPVLNVEYQVEGTSCGPSYRDWQNVEYAFVCDGRDVANLENFRVCTSPPKTIVDPPHEDGGNYNGVAFYTEGDYVVITSQLKAGWYRYTSEWRLFANGTILPRWGFGGVMDSVLDCVCVRHHHHAYWRFDFDIETTSGNTVAEFNDPPLPGSIGKFLPLAYEVKRPKDASRKRYWEIANARSGNKYALYPGPADRTGDGYGVDGVWVLNYLSGSVDDGPPPPNSGWTSREHTKARLDNLIGRRPLNGADVVLWYAAHFMHDEPHLTDGGGHVVGPALVPLKW